MRTKKIVALLISATTLVTCLSSCSAYNNPSKYISIPDYTSLTVKAADVQTKVDEQIKSVCESSKGQFFDEVTDADAKVQKGDKVNIDYTGTPSSEISSTSSATLVGEDKDFIVGGTNSSFPTTYTSGSETLYKSFEDQLIGAKKGETVNVSAKFSASFTTEDLRDVVVTYTVTINSISRITLTKEHDATFDYTTAETLTDDISAILVNPPKTAETVEDNEEGENTTETTKKPFSDLFKSQNDITVDIGNDDNKNGDTAIATMFTMSDIADYFVGKNLYQKFAVGLVLPSTTTASDYLDYVGKTIYVIITIDGTTIVPKWSDEIIATSTNNQYETTAAYEEYIWGLYQQSLAYEAILEETTIIKYPKKERDEYYKSAYNNAVYEFLGNVDPLTLTQKELDEKLKNDKEKLQISAMATALSNLKNRLLLEYLFDDFGIKLSKTEYKDGVKKLYEESEYYYYYTMGLTQYNQDFYESQYGEEYFELQLKSEKAYEKLLTCGITFEEKTAG